MGMTLLICTMLAYSGLYMYMYICTTIIYMYTCTCTCTCKCMHGIKCTLGSWGKWLSIRRCSLLPHRPWSSLKHQRNPHSPSRPSWFTKSRDWHMVVRWRGRSGVLGAEWGWPSIPQLHHRGAGPQVQRHQDLEAESGRGEGQPTKLHQWIFCECIIHYFLLCTSA